MPALPVIAAVGAAVGAGAAVVGTIKSVKAQGKAAAAQQQEFKYQRQIDNYKAARERTQAIRQARLSRGTALQAATTQGAGGGQTSASLGGLGSIDSQLQSNLSFLDTSNKLSDLASEAAGRASKYGAAAQIWGSVASAGVQVFNASGGVPAIKKVV